MRIFRIRPRLVRNRGGRPRHTWLSLRRLRAIMGAVFRFLRGAMFATRLSCSPIRFRPSLAADWDPLPRLPCTRDTTAIFGSPPSLPAPVPCPCCVRACSKKHTGQILMGTPSSPWRELRSWRGPGWGVQNASGLRLSGRHPHRRCGQSRQQLEQGILARSRPAGSLHDTARGSRNSGGSATCKWQLCVSGSRGASCNPPPSRRPVH